MHERQLLSRCPERLAKWRRVRAERRKPMNETKPTRQQLEEEGKRQLAEVEEETERIRRAVDM